MPGKTIRLPAPLRRPLDRLLQEQLRPEGGATAPGRLTLNFLEPNGEAALVPAESISWRIFKNPIALLVGGVAAVLLELAEPRVRTGVWEHTTFRTDPLRRMRRTGLAAMVTVYGPRGQAETMIAGIRRMHDRVRGTTPAGVPYEANDPVLLGWVQATAAYGFLAAYVRFVHPLARPARDRYYAEGPPVACLYGVPDAPSSEAELDALFARMLPALEPSAILDEFIQIMRTVPLLPRPFRLSNRLILRAALSLIPDQIRAATGLDAHPSLSRIEGLLLRQAGRLSDRLLLPSHPAVQASLRLGLPDDFCYGPGR